MRDVYIEHDKEIGVLRIKTHNTTNPQNNRYVRELCKVLNYSKSIFRGTKVRINNPGFRNYRNYYSDLN